MDLEWDTNADTYRLAFNDFEDDDDQDLIVSNERGTSVRKSLRKASDKVIEKTSEVIQKVENIVKNWKTRDTEYTIKQVTEIFYDKFWII